MGKPILPNLNIAVTGDFGERRSTEKMRSWIQINGATFAYDISPKVTHLICSKEHYTKKVKMVQQAREIKTIKIVSFDWLEDSLMAKSAKREAEYLMGAKTRAAAETKARKKTIRRKNIAKGMEVFERSCKEFEKDMHTDGYGIYHDSTTLAYDITLARANLLTNKNERYALRLYVSHSTPKYYAAYVKYSAPGLDAKGEVLAPTGSTWETAWDAFEKFFQLKTRKEWDARFLKAAVNGGGDGGEGGDGPPFVYAPPKEGTPRGLFLEW